MDRVHAGRREFDSHRGHMFERFFRSNRPGYPHPVSSELENSGIRVAVGDFCVTGRRRWRPPYQTGETVHVHAKHYKHNVDGRTAPGVCGNGSVPLSHSGNHGVTRGSKAPIRVDPYFKNTGRSVKIRVDTGRPVFQTYGSIRKNTGRPVFLRIDPVF